MSDISFASLQIWWNLDDKLTVSDLNGNMVISYNQPLEIQDSGLGLVGTYKIDESIKIIFKELKAQNKQAKLMHIAEFVVSAIKYPDQFEIEEQQDDNEYVLNSHELAELKGSSHARLRQQISRFLREVGGRELQTKELNLSDERTRQEVFAAIAGWSEKFKTENDPEFEEKLAIEKTLNNYDMLGMKNLCVYVGGKLMAVLLYHQSANKNYYIANHLKVDYSLSNIFDYAFNQLAKVAVSNGVEFINIEMDLGLEGLRKHKKGLRPVSFFKKYSIKDKSKT